MVGRLEATFEVPGGDALLEHIPAHPLVVGLLLASERQRVLLCLDREISDGKAGDCNRDAIVVLAIQVGSSPFIFPMIRRPR